jgi:hypothetical protein
MKRTLRLDDVDEGDGGMPVVDYRVHVLSKEGGRCGSLQI